MQKIYSFIRLSICALLFSALPLQAANYKALQISTGKVFQNQRGAVKTPNLFNFKQFSWRNLARPTRLLKSSAGRTLVGAGLLALVGASCSDDGHHGEPCNKQLTILNTSNLETWQIWVDGSYKIDIAPQSSGMVCWYLGDRLIEITETYSGAIVHSIYANFYGDSGEEWRTWTLNDPLESRIEINNQTSQLVKLTIDGRIFDNVKPGFWAYPVREGNHSVSLTDPATDYSYYYGGTEYFFTGIPRLFTVNSAPGH